MQHSSKHITSELLARAPGVSTYRGRRRSDARPVILKVYARHPDAPALELSRLERLSTEGTMQALEIERGKHETVLVLEDFGGRPLTDILAKSAVGLSLGDRLSIAIRATLALAGVHHQGYVHRALTTATLVVNLDTGVVKLDDLHACTPAQEQVAGIPPLGALTHVAPEQTGRVDAPCDHRADLYRLGVTLFELFTGRLPFEGETPAEVVHGHLAVVPPRPRDLVPELPRPLDGLITKLLAKSADDRYQSALGVVADLERCLAQRLSGRTIDDFELGRHDSPQALRIPTQLYGRVRDLAKLWRAYVDVRAGGRALALISGPAGIGKTALVDQLRRAVIDDGGTLIQGKFDALARHTPLAVFTDVLEQLVARLLTEGDDELAMWRETLREVLGINAQLMIELVPSLELVIGPQPPAPEVEPGDRLERLERFVSGFFESFCQGESPLVLFLDDLQWADRASLELLQSLLERTESNLLVVGSRRDADKDPAPQLDTMLTSLATAQVPVVPMELAPLSEQDIAEFLADALWCELDEVRPLAKIVRHKSDGAPLFVRRFLARAHESGALTLERQTQRWRWDLAKVEAIEETDNVIELTIAQLPPALRECLARGACIGAEFSLAQLGTIGSDLSGDLLRLLQAACRAHLLVRVTRIDAPLSFAFPHDGIRQAAYRVLDEQQRASLHLQFARSSAGRSLSLFERVGHLDAGLALLLAETPGERMRTASIYRAAAAKASSRAAFRAAIDYLEAAAQLLPADAWDRDHSLAFSIHLARVEGYLALATHDALREALPELSRRAETVEEQAAVLSVQSWHVHSQGDFDEALRLELELISLLGIALPDQTAAMEARCRENRVRIDAVSSSAWTSLPSHEGAPSLARALAHASSTALSHGKKLHFEMLVTQTLVHSLEQGRTSATALALAYYATLQLPHDQAGRDRAIELGAAASTLAEGHPVEKARVEFSNSVFVYCWTRPFAEARASMEQARHLAHEVGEQVFASFALWLIALLDNLEGGPLPRAIGRYEALHDLARGQSVYIASLLQLTLGLCEALEGTDPSEGLRRIESFEGGPFAEEFIHVNYAGLAKRVVLYIGGEHQRAWELSVAHAPAFNEAFAGSFHVVYTTFFHAMIAAARAGEVRGKPREDAIEQLRTAVGAMEMWAEWVPENFSAMHLLARAELLALERGGLLALDGYDEAIAAAEDGPAYLRALANERAARFLQSIDRASLCWAYLGAARLGYQRWGARAKADQLAVELRTLQGAALDEVTDDGPHHSAGADRLDTYAMMQSIRAISGELDITRLLATTLDIIVKNAGAERGLLLLEHEHELEVAARIGAHEDYADHVVQWVRRTGKAVVLADAADSERFSSDPHIREQRPRSLLCMPLRSQHHEHLGLLYLENNLQPEVFSERRLEALELLLAQTSISLENARLFHQRTEAEADLRTAYEIIGQSPIIVLAWQHTSPQPILFVSDNVERLLGYSTSELVTWANYAQLLHPDDRAEVLGALEAAAEDPLITQLRQQPYRVVSAAGDTRWLAALTVFERDERGQVGVCRGIVEDVTDKHELTTQLLHAQKLDAIGLLAGGIAHDFNNLLTVILGNANRVLTGIEDTALRGNVQEIVSAASRAAGVTRQLLLFSRKDRIEPRIIDAAEVVGNMLHMLERVIGEGIELEFTRPEALDAIKLDPSQLEQIVLNLVVNARDAMPEGGRVHVEVANIRTSEGEPRVSLSVSDTGHGMSPQVRAKMFDPFFTTKAAGEGTGLGLATVHSITTTHGGTIRVQSEPGEGSRFELTFPRIDPARLDEAAHSTAPAQGRGELVLVIEDDDSVRDIIARHLEHHGYRVLTSASLEQTRERAYASRVPIELVLADVVLRDKSGAAAVEAVHERYPEAKVVFMSGHADAKLAEHGALRPGVQILSKPFGPEQLTRRLREALDEEPPTRSS